MSIILPLSSIPAARLKEQVDAGAFPWSDFDAAASIVKSACSQSDGDPEREAQLIMLALRENVPSAIRRSIERKPDSRMERSLASVADYYGQLKHIASQMSPQEARWSVDTLAAMANLIPVSAVGASESTANASRPTTAPRSNPAAASAPPTPSWAATQALSSAPPWAQSPSESVTAPKVPAALNATTSLPPLPGMGFVAGAGVPYERPSGAPSESWPPPPPVSHTGGIARAAVPEEVSNRRWSWAAFLGGWIWMAAHRMPVGFLFWIGIGAVGVLTPKPFGTGLAGLLHLSLNVYLGVNGNRLAWDKRPFNSVEQFRAVQRAWVTVMLVLIVVEIVGFALILFPVFMHAYNAAHHASATSP